MARKRKRSKPAKKATAAGNARRGARPTSRGKKPRISAAAETGTATLGRPQLVESRRAALLVLPPSPTEKQLKAREKCIEHTHRPAGPKLEEGPGARRVARAVRRKQDVPETTPRPTHEAALS